MLQLQPIKLPSYALPARLPDCRERCIEVVSALFVTRYAPRSMYICRVLLVRSQAYILGSREKLIEVLAALAELVLGSFV